MSTEGHRFDRETAIRRVADDLGLDDLGLDDPGLDDSVRFDTDLSASWNIGDNPNGGYLAAGTLRAMTEVAGQPDPLSVTMHFLRPGTPGESAEIRTRLVRPGRRVTTVAAELHQQGRQRLQMIGAFGDLGDPNPADVSHPELTLEPVDLPDPDECVDRRSLEQGVDLPILDRLDVRIDPRWAVAGASDRAQVSGWIRFSDGRPVDAMALPLFADAFPPSVFSLLGSIGWVPTLELTVHVRRRPEPGWIRARFTTQDLSNGMLVENGDLWDSSGRLVARARQLALLLT